MGILTGTISSLEKVIEQDWQRECFKIRAGVHCFDGSPSVVPSVSSLCARVATAKVKAIAEDLLGAELGKAAPAAMLKKWTL